MESGNKPRLFSGRIDNNKLSFSEAARWLLYTHAFDVAPAGRPPTDRVIIKGYGLPWVSELGLIWAEGNNLFETLMLNFVLVDHNQEQWAVRDINWEKEEITTEDTLKDITFHQPGSPAELFTMQFRRIQLQYDESKRLVTGYDLWSGIKTDYNNAFYEIMTTWQKDKENKNWVPKKHSAERQMWRDFSSILETSENSVPSGVVKWINLLQEKGELQTNAVTFRTAGIEYKNNATVKHIYSDSLQVNTGLLSRLGEEWLIRISNVLRLTDDCVGLLGTLALNLVKASGDSDSERIKAGANTAKAEAYFRLDMPFRTWLADIDPAQSDMDEAEQDWINIVKQVLLQLGEEIAHQTGERAITGRWVERNTSRGVERKLYTAPGALVEFRANIKRTIGKGGL